jgi:hypothetical protein
MSVPGECSMVTNRMGHPRCSTANPNRLEHELRACSMLCSIVFRPFLLGGARHAEFTLLPVVVTGSVRGGGPIRRPTLLPVRRLSCGLSNPRGACTGSTSCVAGLHLWCAILGIPSMAYVRF